MDKTHGGRTVGTALRIVIVAAAYYAGARLGLVLALVHEQVTPLWPPTGIAVFCLLMFGLRASPGIALGAFLVNLPIGPSVAGAATIAAGNTLAPVCAYLLLRRFDFRVGLDRFRDAIALIFLAALGGMAVSATVGSGVLVLSGAVPAEDFFSTWWVWWTGDAMGVLVVTPLLLALRWARPVGGVPASRRPEAGVLLVSTLVVAVYGSYFSQLGLFLVFPFLVWSAMRFQLLGSAPCVLIVSTSAILAAADGRGRFAGMSLLEEMVTLQGFNGVVALTGLILAVVARQRDDARQAVERAAGELEDRVRERTAELAAVVEHLRRSELETQMVQQALSQSELKFRTLLHAAPDAVIGIDGSGRIVFANHRTEQIFGYDEGELLGRQVEDLMPPRFRDQHVAHRAGFFAAPRTRLMGLDFELSAQRKDGSEFAAHIALAPLQTEDGVLVVAAVRDVTGSEPDLSPYPSSQSSTVMLSS